MASNFGTWLQKIKHPYITGFAVLLVLVLILFIFLAYRFGWDWTGFSSGTNQITITSASKGNYTATISQPSKSLWDWLQLLGVLAIPAVVALGAAWYTAQQGKVSDAENTDNQRETALQTYIDKMSKLLLENKLSESVGGEEVRQIARVLTLTVLRRLDAKRKGDVLQFLYEAKLIDKDKRVVDLRKADLSGADLSSAYLSGADLSAANLRSANLSWAILTSANLSYANLSRANLGTADLSAADLSRANLTSANLSANLSGANLSEADLSFARLSMANLSNAQVSEEQLAKAEYLQGTIMPDGSIHP